MKVVIIGGVAGGANVATRLRRLSEDIEILMLEKGGYVSFANCGMPYHLGNEIPERSKLIMATPQSLAARYTFESRIRTEATAIDLDRQVVMVKDLAKGAESEEAYDHLVIATGALPIRPPLPGIDAKGIFVLRDLDDMDGIKRWITERAVKRAVVVGGGFIGIEVVEQLKHVGIEVSLVEAASQVLAPLDPEMAAFVEKELRQNGVDLRLGDGLASFEADQNGAVKSLTTASGVVMEAELVVMGIGVRPNVALAKAAGIELGVSGAIKVDRHMRTNVANVWALGDAVELTHAVLGQPMPIPLAGPANRQGRIVADNIAAVCAGTQPKSEFKGGLGTAIARAFGLAAASTGANEKQLTRFGIAHQSVFVHPNSHAGYYPGAFPIALKLIYSPEDGRILGAQAVGKDGVDKRIDVIATAIAGGLTVDDLIDLELTYAPPFGSAKDAVNIAGMVAQNERVGLAKVEHPYGFDSARHEGTVLDVRDADETPQGMLPGAVHIPLGELRSRLTELDRSRPVVVYCQSGMRSYLACRILQQNGFECRNLSGAFKSWSVASGG